MTLCAVAAEKRTYPCHRLAQTPALDGKLDDAAWKDSPDATGFYIYKAGGSDKYALEKQTCFKAGWTEDALYIAVRAEESAPEKLMTAAKDNGEVWGDDSIELFFFPAAARNYTQLVVNSAGRRYNGRGYESINLLDWEAKAVVDKTEWRVELRIPFAVLMAQSPKEGDEWAVNIARNLLTGPDGERHTCWPLLQAGFHDAPNFGRFVFKGAAGDKVTEEEKINGSYVLDMQREVRELADMAGKYEQELDEAQKSEKMQAEAEELRRTWEQAAKAVNTTNTLPDMRELRTALQTSASLVSTNLQQKSDDCIGRGMLETLFKD